MDITPLVPAGYEGKIKQLSCSDCHRSFTVTREYFETKHPLLCFECSVRAAKRERTRQENLVSILALEQADQDIKSAHSDEVIIEELKNAVGRLVVQTYIEHTKKIVKKVTGSEISELDAIELAQELIEEDQYHHIKPIMRLLLGDDATPDTEEYKKRDEKGRVILELIGKTIWETQYDDDTGHPSYSNFYDYDDKKARKTNPEAIAWAEALIKKHT